MVHHLGPLNIHDNPVGWGPFSSYETDIPYQPFSKVIDDKKCDVAMPLSHTHM